MVYMDHIRKAPVNRIEIKSQPTPAAVEKPQEVADTAEEEKPKRGRKAKED